MHVSQYKKIIEEQRKQIADLKQAAADAHKAGVDSTIKQLRQALSALVEADEQNFKLLLDNGPPFPRRFVHPSRVPIHALSAAFCGVGKQRAENMLRFLSVRRARRCGRADQDETGPARRERAAGD